MYPTFILIIRDRIILSYGYRIFVASNLQQKSVYHGEASITRRLASRTYETVTSVTVIYLTYVGHENDCFAITDTNDLVTRYTGKMV